MFKVLKVFIIPILFFFTNPLHAKSFVMAFGDDPNNNNQYVFYNEIYSRVFNNLGYEFSFVVCPSKRCSKLANSGKVDGEPQRVKNYGSRFENLVRVDFPIFINRSIALSRNKNIQINGLSSLDGKKLRVGYIRGSKWSRDNLKLYVSSDQLEDVSTIDQGLRMLVANRIDIFVGLEASVLKVLNQPHYQLSDIYIAGILGENNSYPYLHISHIDLVPNVEKELMSLKSSGEYHSIMKKVLPYMIQ